MADAHPGPDATANPSAARQPRWIRALLAVPLFYKILVANAAIAVVGTAVGITLTREFLRQVPGESTLGLIVALALAGVAITALVNALILRLALKPLELLERTAAEVHRGNLDARVPILAVADRSLVRLTQTFNAMLDGLAAYGERLREVAARALTAEEEERKRIARELHDDTAQRLAVLLIRLKLARNLHDRHEREQLLDQLRDEIGEALEGVRRFARGLRPVALEELGLVRALEGHVRTLSESVGVDIRLEADALDGVLSSPSELVLYRIVQEALSNAVRHSGAGRIDIGLRRGERAVLATVRDDGHGFRVERQMSEQGPGLGLFGMQERAAYVGGRVAVRSAPGAGTTVWAEIPFRVADGPA